MRFAALSLLVLATGCSCSSVAGSDAAFDDGATDPDAETRADAAVPDAATPPSEWLATGGFTSCASLDGHVWCWGTLWTGVVATTPIEMAELAGVERLAITHSHACALRSDGAVACAGSNRTGQLGVDPAVASRDTFAPVPGVDDAIDVAVGTAFACALRTDGVVLCWGDDALGETGSPIPPHATGASVAQPTPVPVQGVSDAIAIAAGDYQGCAVIADGTVRCWGYDWFGALGRGAGYTGMPQSVADEVEGLTAARSIAIDGNASCALREDGSVWCWGASVEIHPGYDAATADDCPVVVSQPCWRAPRPVAGVSGALALRFGGRTACITMPGAWQCWGRDDEGQATGDGSVSGAIAELAVGRGHVCARDLDGRVACRGRGVDGQLGDGTSTSSRSFVLPSLP